MHSFVKIGSLSIEVFLFFSFSHSIIKLWILLFPSFKIFLHVPPFVESVELIEQRLLKENFVKVFSLFTSHHDIDVLQIFYILQVDFVPTCLQVQSFDSQQGRNMDVHDLNLC